MSLNRKQYASRSVIKGEVEYVILKARRGEGRELWVIGWRWVDSVGGYTPLGDYFHSVEDATAALEAIR